jgi:diguanylate cyclase (GGDEF)-like protein/PAS domain S-box-containing protein
MVSATNQHNTQNSEQRSILNSLFKVLPDLFFLMDQYGTILDYQGNEKSKFNRKLQQFLGKKIYQILPPYVGFLFEESIRVVLNDDEMVSFDYEQDLDNGNGIQQFQARLLKLPESNNIILIIQDITERMQMELALKNSESIYRQMFEKNQAIKLIIDSVDGYILEANAAALAFYGYNYQELIAKRISDINTLSEQEVLAEMQLAKKEQRIFLNFRHQIASGEIKDVEVYSGPITVGGKILLYSIVQDVTNKKQIENELFQTEQQFRDLFNNISSEIYIKDLHGIYLSVNQSFTKTYDLTSDDVKGKSDFDLFPEHLAKAYHQSDLQTIKLDAATFTEDEVPQPKGSKFYSSVKFPLKDPNGKTYALCGISTDVTDKKLSAEKILHQAHFDPLTDLPNRFLALDRLSQMLNEAQRKDEQVAVLFLDLDDFKKINDSLGHEVGDKLLIEAAYRLASIIRNEDTVGRLGGDEFIVLLRGLTNETDVQPVTEALLDKFRQPFIIDNKELILTASVGIALYPDDATTASELLRNADTAMYQAKALGRNSYSYFTEAMNHDVSRRLALEQQIRGALERNEFDVYYQIQIGFKNRQIIGAEALLRWHNVELGDVSPEEFIPIAEQTGLIVPLGQFVLDQALATIKQWHQLSHTQLRIAVNLSPRQFRDPELVHYIQQALTTADIDASNLELEITEGVLMSGHAYIEDALTSLSQLGVILSMDDFGTGYSSLSYLRTYPFNVLKIDRCFISRINNEHADKELVNATIAMSHALGLKVVAEGVENLQQYQLLESLGCDYAQGYLFSKPIPKADLFVLATEFSF